MQDDARPRDVALMRREEHRGSGIASSRSTRSLLDKAKYHSNPSGGCVVGQCGEACPSSVPVYIFVSRHGSLARLKAY